MDVEKTMEFILHSQAEVEMAQIRELQARSDRRLDRAVRLAVREGRNERKKRLEMDSRLDEKLTQLAAAQLVTGEKLQGLIDILGRRGNGSH